MAPPRLSLQTSNCSLLLIYLPREDERLSRAIGHFRKRMASIIEAKGARIEQHFDCFRYTVDMLHKCSVWQ